MTGPDGAALRDTATCGRCGGTRTGPYCKPCRRTYATAWRKANPEKTRAYRAEHQRRWKHGLSSAEFEARFDAQGRSCAICRSVTANGAGWHIDHDHACCPTSTDRRCGECFRGILCHGCNVGLGHFGDDPDRLLAAIRYLGTARDPQQEPL